jgi:hypothetical protein
MTDPKTQVWVTIAIGIGGETKTFEADASTTDDAHDIAQGLLSGLDTQADRWLFRAGNEARRGY